MNKTRNTILNALIGRQYKWGKGRVNLLSTLLVISLCVVCSILLLRIVIQRFGVVILSSTDFWFGILIGAFVGLFGTKFTDWIARLICFIFRCDSSDFNQGTDKGCILRIVILMFIIAFAGFSSAYYPVLGMTAFSTFWLFAGVWVFYETVKNPIS
jgi:H+/Cl- antiporter ClcA